GTFGKRLAPVGFLGRKLDDATAASDIDFTAIAEIESARSAERGEEKFNKIAARGGGELVEETGENKLVAGGVDGAPVPEWHSGIGDSKLEAEVGSKSTREIEGIDLSGLLRRDAGAVVENFDGWGRATMEPGDQIVFVVEAGLQEMVCGRTVKIVAN